MTFNLYTADCTGNPKNSSYPNCIKVICEDDLRSAARLDHVCAEFKDGRRSVAGYICSNVEVMDCDNDHTDDPDKWITPEKLTELFPDVTFAAVYSRNNMKPKGAKSARPRFHVYFPHKAIFSAEECAVLKRNIYRKAPFFDGNALDAARFIFGNTSTDIYWNEGIFDVDDFLEAEEFSAGACESEAQRSFCSRVAENSNSDNFAEFEEFDRRSELISEGSRNTTLSRFAGRVVKRYGIGDKSREMFLKEAEKCEPPLPESELEVIWKSAEKFALKVAQCPNYIPPEEYGKTLEPEDFSDIGQARALVSEYGEELVYTDATDYMRYDGTHWVESKQLAVGAAEEFLDLQLAEADQRMTSAAKKLRDSGIADGMIGDTKKLKNNINDQNRGSILEYCSAAAYKAFVMKRRDMKYVQSALQAAKPMLLKDIKDFDKDGFLLCTPSATYDMRQGIGGAREHRAEDRITKITAVSPDSKNAEMWENAVSEFFCGDEMLIRYVRQIVGLAAIGKVYVEALIISYGQGRNGKSTFWNTIAKVLGSYSGSISADALMTNCKRNVKPEMAELKGKRLVIAAEPEEGMRLNTSVVKQLCSTDEVSAEKKYKDPFSYTPTHTLVLYTNHLPRVGAPDDGTWRRLIVIPFNAKITGNSDIKNYSDTLIEKAGGAVLSWIIEGAREVMANNFRLELPDCVKEAIERYRSNDWLNIFIGECCETDPAYTQKSGDLYKEYRAYCEKTKEFARNTTDFYSALELAGYTRKKTSKGILVCGLKLKSDFPEDDSF